MLNKSTMMKIGVAVLVVCIVWFVMKLRKSSKPNVIVTAMPVMQDPMGYVNNEFLGNEADDYAELPATTSKPVAGMEAYSNWQADEADDVQEESYVEYSSPEFKTDLLET